MDNLQNRLRSICKPLALACALGPLSGCRRQEITHFTVKKAPEAALAAGALAPSGADAPGEVAPPPAPAGALKWKLPKGWSETMTGGMRYATLKPPTPGRLEVSVVVLPGPAGGELANANRWRGQIGLPPLDQAAMASARKALRAKAGDVSLYDFTSEGQKKSRLVAGLLVVEGSTWFVKMTGDADPVAPALPDFIRLLESLYAAN